MGSKVKQKHLLLLQKKVREKLCSLREQKEMLLFTINQYVEKAESSAEQLLSSASPGELMEKYLEIVQELDRCCDTCLLLTATAEDMIDNTGSSKEDIFTSDCSEQNKELSTLTCSFEKDNDDGRTRLTACDTVNDNENNYVSHNAHKLPADIDKEKTPCAVDLQSKGDYSQSCERGDNYKSLESRNNNFSELVSLQTVDSIRAKSVTETQLESQVVQHELPQSVAEVSAGIDINRSHIGESSRDASTCPNSTFTSPCKQLSLRGETSSLTEAPEGPSSSPPTVENQPQEASICKSTPRLSLTEEDYGMGPTISHCTITVGLVIPVVVSEIATPWAFYVQQFGFALNNLRASINLYKEKLLPGEATLDRPRVGMVCLALFNQDENYYRAKIIRVTEREGEQLCDVIYLDFGNCETVKSAHLLQLPAFLAELPSQAIFCCLSGVSPMNKLGLWTEDEIIRFREYVAGQQLNCKAAFVSPKQSLSFPHLVDLCLNMTLQQTDSEAGRVLMTQVNVAAILVQRKLARPIPVSEQIAKLQNQFGDLASPSSSKSASPKKPQKPPPVKKEPDVVVEETEIVDVSGSSVRQDPVCKGVSSPSPRLGGHCGEAAQASSQEEHQGPSGQVTQDSCEQTQKASDTSTDNVLCSNLESQNGSKQTQEISVNKSIPVEVKATEVPSTKDSHGVESASQSPSKSCTSNVDGETTTSGVTDMSLNPLFADCFDTPTEEYDVMIAHIVTPNDFYVHRITEDVGKTLNRLMKDLNLHFERQSRKQLYKLYRSFKPSVRKLCCAQFSQDSSYFRAQIVGLKEADGTNKKEDLIGKIHVFYIDFGDSEWLPRSKVFPMPEEFSCFPPLTIWCSLANVKPISSRWTDANINEFERLAGDEKKLSLLVVGESLPHINNRCTMQTSPLEVFLTDKINSEEEVCINLELMRLKQAAMLVDNLEFPTDGSDESEDPVDREWEVDTWDPLMEDYISLRNSYKVDVDDAGVATVGYKAQDEKRICKYFNTPGRCWRGEYCPFKHVQPGEGVTQDQEYVLALEDDQTDILPDEGVMVAVEITSILSPRHFYLTLPFGKTPIDQLQAKQESATTEDDEDHEETLADLVRSMKVTYQNRSFTHRDILLLAPGQAVAAKFVSGSEIGWYRAKVTDTLPEENKVEVYFVDFGHTEWVKEGDIHELEPRYLHLPQQAVECFMVGIEPPSPNLQWSQEARERFREMVDGKTLVAQIITRSWSGCLHVDLYDTTDSVDVNIANTLIKEGHARQPATPPVQIREERPESPAVILVPG